MKTVKTSPRTLLISDSTKGAIIAILWLGFLFIAWKYLIQDAIQYFGMTESVFGRYWEYKWWLIGHISGGMLALVIGPFQFTPAIRRKYLNLHRWLGRLYLTGIAVGAFCSFYMAFTSAAKIHWSWSVALIGLGLPWLLSAAMAFRAIRRRRIQQHKEWMIRSYVITFAFVTFRFLNDDVLAGIGSFIERGPTLIWLSWTVPLFITEIIIQWNKR